MNLIKVQKQFFEECKLNHTEKELMLSDHGRPCVLLIKLKYKERYHDFAVPIRSNISKNAPRYQYFSLPPNSSTKNGCVHGIHYIKLFPIHRSYILPYLIEDNVPLLRIKRIIDKHEKEIVNACQQYLYRYENGKKHSMTPDIDGILKWMDKE